MKNHSKLRETTKKWPTLGIIAYLSTTALFHASVNAEAPDVNGDVDISVTTKGVTNTASADNSIAQVVLGSLNSGTVQGKFKAVVATEAIINTANGTGSCSQIILGSVGVNNC